MSNNHGEILDQARKAYQSGDYTKSLQKYKTFFEQTTNTSYYGVRLSYCLNEWKDLADIYPDALIALKTKRDESLALLMKTRNPEYFHDYKAICEVLGSPEQPLKEFLHLHTQDRALSTEIVKFIWEELTEQKEWTICLTYLPTPLEKYASYLKDFDAIMDKNLSEDSTPAQKETIGYTIKWFMREISTILLVLKHDADTDNYTLLREKVSSDLQDRGLDKLDIAINRIS